MSGEEASRERAMSGGALALLVAGAAALGLLSGLMLGSRSGGAGADARAHAVPADDSPVVARVGSEVVTLAQFDARWAALGAPGRAFYDQRGGRREFLEEVADELALATEARARGLDAEPSTRELARSAANRAVARPLLAREVRAQVIPESELRAYFDAHRLEFAQPAEAELWEIIVTSNSGSGPRDDTPDLLSARAKAERLRAALTAGEDFAAVARRASEAPSAGQGGLLGWQSAGGLPPAHEQALSTLAVGAISDVVDVPEGLAIFKVTARRDAREPAFEEAREDILDRLLADDPAASSRRYAAFVGDLRKRLGTEVKPALVD